MDKKFVRVNCDPWDEGGTAADSRQEPVESNFKEVSLHLAVKIQRGLAKLRKTQ